MDVILLCNAAYLKYSNMLDIAISFLKLNVSPLSWHCKTRIILYTKYVYFLSTVARLNNTFQTEDSWENAIFVVLLLHEYLYFLHTCVYVRVWVWLAECINCTFYGYKMLVCTYLRVFAVFLSFSHMQFPTKRVSPNNCISCCTTQNL